MATELQIASDIPKGTALLAELISSLDSVSNSVKLLAEKLNSGNFNTAEGLSLLELKNHSFLSYLCDLTYIILRKLYGKKVEGDKSVDRLVEHRVVLERIRPIEDKLKYQIEKYLKLASTGIAEVDLTSLKGNLDNIASSDEEEETKGKNSPDETDPVNEGNNILYKVPKVSQAHFPDEENTAEAKAKARRRLLNSAMMKDALYEHADDPEVVSTRDLAKEKILKRMKEIERYEEEYMTRVPLTRSDKASMKQLTTANTIASDLLSFSRLDALDGNYDPRTHTKSKKRKSHGKQGKKKGFKKRKKR